MNDCYCCSVGEGHQVIEMACQKCKNKFFVHLISGYSLISSPCCNYQLFPKKDLLRINDSTLPLKGKLVIDINELFYV